MDLLTKQHTRRPPGPSVLSWLLILVLSGCSLAGDDGDVAAGVDLDELFAPAQPAEIQRAAEAWVDRDVTVRAVELVQEAVVTDPFGQDWHADVRVYGHEVDGATHFGAVVVPSDERGRARPVLLFLHGGDDGVSLSQVALALAFQPEMREEYIVVVPSFRSEPLVVGERTFQSDGPSSPWDRDVDDSIALLNVALETTPAADGDRIVALGFSRGAAVGLLAAIRDERIDGVAAFFGPADFLGPFARDLARDMLRNDLPSLPGIRHLDMTLLEPLQEGELGMEEARIDLIRRSAVYFADRLPAVQVHHGLDDSIVPPSESERLADALDAAGRADYEVHFYESGVHDPLSLQGALDRLETFLLSWVDPPA